MTFDIGDYLKTCYIELVGEKPSEGGWRANEDTINGAIEYTHSHYGGTNKHLKQFLLDSMKSFLSRFGSPPSVPFFVNTQLLADKSLKHLGTFKGKVDGLYESNSTLEGFWGMVKGEILMSELAYLEGPISVKPPDPTLHNPSVWWMCACLLLKRFPSAHKCWLSGEVFSLTHDRYVSLEWLYSCERDKLRSDKVRRDQLMHQAQLAIKEATLSWLASNKIVTTFHSPSGVTGFNAIDQSITDRLTPLVNAYEPLSERDASLRELVASVAGHSDEAPEQERDFKRLKVVSALFTDNAFVRKYIEHSEE